MDFEFNYGMDDFTLVCPKCEFNRLEVICEDGSEKTILAGKPKDKDKVMYAFSADGGLCHTNQFGTVMGDALLTKIVSVDTNNEKAVLHIFEENGYFFPLSNTEINEVDLPSITELIKRIKAAVFLMAELENNETDYDRILHLTMYFLLRHEIKLAKSTDKKTVYTSLTNSAIKALGAPSTYVDENYESDSEFEYYSVPDRIYPKTFKFSVEEYTDIVQNETFSYDYPGISDELYRKLTSAYKNDQDRGKNQHLIVEFLFHYMHSVGVIKSVSFDDGIEYYGVADHSKFDENLKKALISVARLTLSEEINYNVRGIKPLYSPRNLEPTWKATDLLSALYFSVYYMKPGTEIYRKCANPSCGGYFLVKTTNSLKKYCCDSCRNANNQRDHRKREKKKK